MVIHHIGYDERRGIAAAGHRAPNPLDQLKEIVDAVSVPVQAVGGLSLEQAIACPSYGAPLVVIGAPLAIDADSLAVVQEMLKKFCARFAKPYMVMAMYPLRMRSSDEITGSCQFFFRTTFSRSS